MSLKEKVEAEMKTAMKAKDKQSLQALRGIKSMILLAETEKGKSEGGLSEAAEIQLLSKAAKQRRESAEIYQKEGREDLAEVEVAELKVIEKFLPEQLSDEEIAATIQEIVKQTGASSMKDMGKVMGMAQKKFAGKADNKKVAELVKASLS
ncbi:GatB/YqeY domain-containing protein [Chondrinema litorale]|uniref:GatB/YqeY domain-containing protein n=1 Tax=Chondrinema litorale TaxID=2994555 RepID=UPI002542B8E6|nr:GatB/YqeY domain-containing protein [Chondrinema litorale]UZR94686.1 GatB/YqeY domain-containing protein [Chondrinema litorale]